MQYRKLFTYLPAFIILCRVKGVVKMRMEKISDTQIKFILKTDDLAARDIKMNELSYGSDKAQQLFREIMHLVQDDEDFISGETPLMFEAMRVGVDSLVIVVTKMKDAGSYGAESIGLIPAARREYKFKRGSMIEQQESEKEDSFSVFSFADLDILAAGASRLPKNIAGFSSVHKLDERYFLILRNETKDTDTTGTLETVLYEFGQKHVSNTISRQYLMEHGDIVIAENALEKLLKYHNS